MPAFKHFCEKLMKPEVIPIIAISGCAYGIAGWYLTRLARRPDVVWDSRNNPYPWQQIDQNTRVNLMSSNKNLEKRYIRDRL
ncbi:hypothetical protein BJV82DRAFT_716096 [Fennellomyces sp. T-0311]|nr:hypothetical protein BJV82DRAFT_716096 [Fennellomyces sp. T-0311]